MKRALKQLKIWAFILMLALGNVAAWADWTPAQERSRSSRPRAQTSVASDRGYLDGYDDGYREGKADYGRETERDHRRSQLWHEADRGYQTGVGSLADYREGYRLGFELGYTDGFYGRTINRKAPSNALPNRSTTLRRRDRTRAGTERMLPDGTLLRVRLLSALSTKTNQEGDRFTAQIIEPQKYEGGTMEGYITRLERSGRLTGHTEMVLDFDTVTLRNGRSSPLEAQIERVYIGDSVKTVDPEGQIESASKTRDITIRSAGGAALGAIIGGIAKGGKGAAIGAIIGAGVGAGSVYVQGKKDLILDSGTEMSVRVTSAQR